MRPSLMRTTRVNPARDAGVVGDYDYGYAEPPVDALEHPEDVLGHIGVEFAGGFVGQEQRRVVGQGHSDGHALLLAAGKLGRVAASFVGHLQGFQQFLGAFAPLSLTPRRLSPGATRCCPAH